MQKERQVNSRYSDSQPLISIALATYNGSKFLREQLDSIHSQTYKNIEVVAGIFSTDDTTAILEDYRGVWASLSGQRA